MGDLIKLFILHRYQLLIEVLRTAFKHHQAVRVIGDACELRRALDALRTESVDVLLLDTQLTRDAAHGAIRQLRSAVPAVKILAMGPESDREIIECLEAGASGVVPGDAGLEELAETVVAVHRGDGPHCPQHLAASVIARIAELSHQLRQRPPRSLPEGVRFTPREQEILALLIDGRRNKEIAQELFIALPTVKIHVHKILKKMNVKSRREAVQLALESGFAAAIN